MSEPVWALSRWVAAAYLFVGLSLLGVLGMALWGMYHDFNLVSLTFSQSEVNRLRTHAVRTVAGIIASELKPTEGQNIDYLANSVYLRSHWGRTIPKDDSHLYACVVDMNGKVIAHSNPAREGRQLQPVWYERTVETLGEDIVETKAEALTDQWAYDVRAPIFLDNKEIGSYHSGLNKAWLEAELQDLRSQTRQVWTLILCAMVVLVLLAAFVLFQITRRATVLGQAVKVSRLRRFAEIGQLMAGIVHEIRNPLNAMRLNLHVLGQQQERQARESDDSHHDDTVNTTDIIRETNREIERVEALMRILLGYARPDQPNNETLDMRSEVQATLTFLAPVLEKAEVMVRLIPSDKPLLIYMDRDRLRQVILNLVSNAKDATGPGGHIQVSMTGAGEHTLLTVSDDGPGVPASERERIFEPFYSTKDLGTGLGLALVRRFIEEVGGAVTCERNEPRGAKFILRFPLPPTTVVQENAAMDAMS